MGKISFILRNKECPDYLKTKLFNQCVLTILLRIVWTLTKKNMGKIAKAKVSMETQMLNIQLSDRKRNEWLRRVTNVKSGNKSEIEFLCSTPRQKKSQRWNKRDWNKRHRNAKWKEVNHTLVGGQSKNGCKQTSIHT